MEHRKYERIDGIWQQKSVVYMLSKGFGKEDIEWCVTEKIHGSNFAFYIDQDEVRMAKRGSFLKDGENFFQCLRMKETNGYKIRELWDQMVMVKDLKEIIVYGELFGGSYPHPDVNKIPNVRRIQKGVHYHPDVNFYCFDIMVNGEFLPMDMVEEMCDMCNIFYAKIMFRGTFAECSKYSNKFQTTIPELLGLPTIENNICEGIVLKPTYPLFYEDGERVIFKSKNEKFLEVSKEKKPKGMRKPDDLSPYTVEAVEAVECYINENRLRNVLSKIGSFTKKDFAVIHKLFVTDVLLDFSINTRYLGELLDDEEFKTLKKIVGRMCTLVWRPIYLTEAER